MNISLTKQELVMLLRLANIGDSVMFSELDDENVEFEQHGLNRLHLLNVTRTGQGSSG